MMISIRIVLTKVKSYTAFYFSVIPSGTINCLRDGKYGQTKETIRREGQNGSSREDEGDVRDRWYMESNWDGGDAFGEVAEGGASEQGKVC